MNEDNEFMSIANELLDCSTCLGESLAQQACPPGMMRYVIRQGESLITIARNFNITLTMLLQQNPHINPYYYRAGEEICLPIQEARCPGGQLYTIRNGDTVSSIARTYGITIDQIMKANPYLDPQNLMFGQIICLPVEAPSGGMPQPSVPPSATPITCPAGSAGAYTLKANETYLDVMTRFCLSYAMLRSVNPDITLENVKAGDVLCIPSQAVPECENAMRYTIERGDTLNTIAQKSGLAISQILRANRNLSPCDFVPGRIICIPSSTR